MKPLAINLTRWFGVAFALPVRARSEAETERPCMNMRNRHIGRPHRRSRCVYLEYVHPRARQVTIAGSFNDWRPAVTPMVSMGRGWWAKGLVLPPGRYEYRFVVDGQPMPDPNAAETVPTPNGEVNSVLVVPAEANK